MAIGDAGAEPATRPTQTPTKPPAVPQAASEGRITAPLRRGWERLPPSLRNWARRRDWLTIALLGGIALLALVPRLYGLDWDANNHLHPDEREIVFKSICLSFPGTPRPGGCDPAYTGPGWFFSPNSPLNPHFFAYGTLPQYLLAGVAHLLAWVTHVTHGGFAPRTGTWDDFDHFTLIGRALSALFDTGSVILAGLIGRRLAGGWAGLLAAAFVAVIPFEVQVAHFYAVDSLLLFFVLLTLLACLRLARVSPRTMKPVTDDIDGEGNGDKSAAETASGGSIWGAWGAGLFVGAALGLALATKVSALPLLAPIVVALALRARRRGWSDVLVAALGVVAAGLLAFLITSPYALIDLANFRAQVSEQTALSQGQLDYPYVRQFANTTPYLYEIQQLLLYDMGLPLGLLGLAGFAWAVSRVWRSLEDDWIILVVWIAGYFAVIGSAYTKFSRYMLPVFAPLAICGAGALVALAAWGTRRLAAARKPTSPEAHGVGRVLALLRRDPFGMRPVAWATRVWGLRWWRVCCVGLGLTVLAASTVLTLALVNIYSTPNTRVQASIWIYDHVQPGKTLTNEVWDDPLPIQAPSARTDAAGIAYTQAGHVINPGQYSQVGLNLYDDDTPQKAQQLASQLASADVVVISSQRLLKSIPKLPDRYPMTTRYYQLLFAGQLGFKLAAHFTNQLHFLGFTLNDSGADESFSVYDHPPVWIFTRVGAGLTQDQILAKLTGGLYLPAPSSRSGNQKSLLLSPQNAAADAQSPTLDAQFPPDSLANRIPLVWWLVAVEVLGLISFPFAYLVFPGLRDRGWGLAKLLGLLLLAWLVWLPSSLRLVPFDRSVVGGVFVFMALAGGALAWRLRDELLAFLRAHWRLIAVGEAAFLVAFLAFAWVRALDPDLWHIWRGGEKPMELAYLNAILRSRYMPPYDPMFAGGIINYYYYGQFLVAVLVKLTGIVPTTAFNLAIPLLFALTFSGAYSIVAGLTGRWWAGLAGGFGLVVVGNLDGLGQAIGQWRAILAHQVPAAFDYWQSSRVIPYTINEFPFWSFLYADLHAHLIDLPIVVLLIACAASLVASARAEGSRWRSALPTLAVVALALGAAWCTNTWDLPTYALLFAVALGLRLLPMGSGGGWASVRARITWPALRNYAVAAGLTLAGAYALYAPFHSNFQNFLSGTGTVTTPTDPWLFFVLFGVWLFLLVSYFFVELRDRIELYRRLRVTETGEPDRGTPASRLWKLLLFGVPVLLLAYLLGMKSLLILLLGVGLYLALSTRHSPLKLMTYALLLLGLAIALGVEFIYVRDFLDNSPWERMNTVFKFYYQMWTLFALGGALAFSQLIGRALGTRSPAVAVEPAGIPAREERDTDAEDEVTSEADLEAEEPAPRPWELPPWGVGALRSVWVLALLALVLGSSIFVVAGTQVRVQDPVAWAEVQPPPGGIQPQGLSLDGMAYMRGWYPGDYAAINWMNAHIAGDPVIVEASYGTYNWQGRVAVYTGLPDVVNWWHEVEQRYPYEVEVRQGDVEGFWSTSDPNAALSFLREYGVRYVYLGALERTCYVMNGSACVPMSAGAVGKFTTLEQSGAIRVVYSNADTTIYEVNG
jgi:YYY domain-containing protein